MLSLAKLCILVSAAVSPRLVVGFVPRICAGTRGTNSAVSFCNRYPQKKRNVTPPRGKLLQVRPTEYWEGDDRRWITRMRRRLRRQYSMGQQPVRTTIVVLNLAMFVYQVATNVNMIRRQWPSYWPRHALSMVWDCTWTTSLNGPLTRDFAHSIWRSRYQPHRYLTAGFLHGGILHLLLNLDALRNLPTWLENGLGRGLYVTTFLGAIVAGNVGHTLANTGHMEQVACLGASGGICGLYGLMYVCLSKMGNGRATMQGIARMLLLFICGAASPQVSNSSHIGGFVWGVIMGILCSPSYRKSYSARRKNSLETDIYTRDYRLAMGFGYYPTKRGLVPLAAVWLSCALAVIALPALQRTPFLIAKGMLHPGSL